jgi:hypothetical protein
MIKVKENVLVQPSPLKHMMPARDPEATPHPQLNWLNHHGFHMAARMTSRTATQTASLFVSSHERKGSDVDNSVYAGSCSSWRANARTVRAAENDMDMNQRRILNAFGFCNSNQFSIGVKSLPALAFVKMQPWGLKVQIPCA